MFGRFGPNWPSRAIMGRHDGVPAPYVYRRTTSWDALYFIVAVRFRTDYLGEALRKAKADLPLNDSKLWGLSNVLMLINGLLKYRHPEFTSEMLDEVERMIHGLDEHPFLIPAKLAAIRANRLAKN